tara:strand:- start:71 stop:346 length:276 start_codon:yes stop_codon:yes gene_type:complete
VNQVVVISPDELEAMIERAVSKALGAAKGPEAWLPVATVAARLKKSDKTIRNWCKEGRFTRVSGGDGSPYLVSSLEVDALSRSANSSPVAS